MNKNPLRDASIEGAQLSVQEATADSERAALSPSCDNSDDLQRENLFMLLRQAIKAKGYTYARLAEQLQVSELSIKRLFKDKDCKMSRLLEICSIVGIDMNDLVSMQQRVKRVPEFLDESVEKELAKDCQLFILLIFLLSYLDLPKIQSLFKIDEAELYLRLRRLEKLGIIELLPNARYRFSVPLPIRWRMDGALLSSIEKINHRYISHCILNATSPDYAFATTGRLMSKHSVQKLQKGLEALREEFDYLSTQDQMFYKPEELSLYKLVFGLGEFPMDTILAGIKESEADKNGKKL